MKLRKPAAEPAQASNLASHPEYDFLIQSLHCARRELRDADDLFNQLTDEEAIDYASYNLLAARTKYSYLLKLAKEKKVSL